MSTFTPVASACAVAFISKSGTSVVSTCGLSHLCVLILTLAPFAEALACPVNLPLTLYVLWFLVSSSTADCLVLHSWLVVFTAGRCVVPGSV